MTKHFHATVQPHDVAMPPYNVCGFWVDAAAARDYISDGVRPDVVTGVEREGRCTA